MNVDDLAWKHFHQRGRHKPHEPRQHNQVSLLRFQQFDDLVGLVEGGPVEHQNGDI